MRPSTPACTTLGRPGRPVADPLAPSGGRAAPEVWGQFIEIQAEGLTRAIGVSNYDEAQIDELIAATGVTPAVNQIEWSPALYDAAIVEVLRVLGVTLEGYSPFKSANFSGNARSSRSPSATPSPRAKSSCAGTSSTA